MPDFSQLIIKLIGDASSFDKETRKAMRLLDDFSSRTTQAGARLTAAFTAPLVGMGVAALKTAGQLEQTSVAFKTMLGSSQAAQKHLEDLKRFALSTPFEFEDLTAASRKMQALGFSAQQVLPTLRVIGDAAAGLGLGADGITRITVALGQMKAKGAVQAEEMKQLAEVGIPAWQILAKTLNTDVAGAMKLVEQRAVSSASAVPAILAGINQKFGGLMEQQSKTLLGQWSNFKDQMYFTLAEIGKALAPTAKDTLEFMSKLGTYAKGAAEGFSGLPGPIRQTAVAVGVLVAAAGPMLIFFGQVAAAVKNLKELAPLLAAAGRSSIGVGAAIGAGAATSRAQAAAGVTVGGTFGGGSDTLGIGRALEVENSALKLNIQTKQLAAPVNQAAFDLSVKQATAHKANGIEINKLAFATQAHAEVVRNATFWEAVEQDVRHKGTAAARQAVSVIADLIEAGTAWGKKLEYQTAEGLDAASAMYEYQLALKGASIEAQQAEISTDVYRGTIFEVEAIMKEFGKTGPLALNATENATKRALERMIELYNAGKATADQVQAVGEVYARAVKDRRAGGATSPRSETNKLVRQPLLQVSTIVTDFSRAVSEIIFQTKSFGDAMAQVGKSIVQSLVRGLVEKGVTSAVGALGKFVGSLGGVGKVLGGLFGNIGGSVAGSAVGSAVGGAAGNAVGSAVGSAAGSAAGGAAAGVGSAASAGLSGAINMVTGAVTAVASVVQAFQLHGIGKDTGKMEETLRGILNVLALNGSESVHHFAKQSMYANVGLRDYWQGTGHSLLVKISSNLDVLTSRPAAAAGGITININGGTYTGDTASMQKFADDLARIIAEKTGYRG